MSVEEFGDSISSEAQRQHGYSDRAEFHRREERPDPLGDWKDFTAGLQRRDRSSLGSPALRVSSMDFMHHGTTAQRTD